MKKLAIGMSISLLFCVILELLIKNKSAVDFLLGIWSGMIWMTLVKEKK